MTLDHIGILVPSLEKALTQWETLFGYQRTSDIVLNTRQKVRVVFLAKENSLKVKLFEPSGPDSPVFQAARKGNSLHHLCFKCSSLANEIPSLEAKGARLIVPPEPGEAFNNGAIAFMLAGNLNFELIESSGSGEFPTQSPGKSI